MFIIKEDPKNRQLIIDLKNLDNITVRGIRQSFYQVGSIAIRTINENVLKRPRSGKVYKYKRRRHRASVAGESFANRSGTARKTKGFSVRGAEELEFGFRDKDAKYTKYLEEGTRNMKARPTVGIASRQTQGKMQPIFEREMKKAHEEGFR